jgi:hypothetical protein
MRIERTRLELLLINIYIIINALYINLRVKLTTEATIRLGSLLVINLLPFFTGSWLSLIADFLGILLLS